MGGGKRRVDTRRAAGNKSNDVDKMVINQIMLKFRPIAPKPVTVESSVGFVPLKEKKAKRKYVRVKMKKKKKKDTEDQCNLTMRSDRAEFVTDPVRKGMDWICFDVSGNRKDDIDIDINFIGRLITSTTPPGGLHEVDLATAVERRRVVESWITVESVIGTCEEVRQLPYFTEEEMWKDLETDSCPGFVSNGYDEVQWVNLAYRRMVDPDGDHGGATVVVWLCVKVEKSGFEWWPGFSCRVRLVYDDLVASEKIKKKKQMTVPCDVWKMNSGGYAWRLDVKAALSLGRLT